MSNDIGPHRLAEVPAVLSPDNSAHLRPAGEDFYATLERDFDGFRGHTLVMTHAFDTPWPSWECHPHGDELVYLLEGDTDFVLRVNGADVTVRVREPGSYVLVPRNTWHTARPHAPTRMLFITPGEGTLNEPHPPEQE